jgi:hypothetical protein
MVKGRVWRHQSGSQNLYIEDEQTTQWSKEEFEDTKGIVRIFISKTNRQHNGQRTSLKTPKGQPESLYRRGTDNTMVKRRAWRHQRGRQKILAAPLVCSNSSFDHCVVCSSSIYGFLLPLWCLQTLLLTIVLSVHLRYTDSDYPFRVFKLFFWPLCCRFVYIEEEQTTQWSNEEIEDTTGVVRIFISKTNRQHNGQKKSLKTPKG